MDTLVKIVMSILFVLTFIGIINEIREHNDKQTAILKEIKEILEKK